MYLSSSGSAEFSAAVTSVTRKIHPTARRYGKSKAKARRSRREPGPARGLVWLWLVRTSVFWHGWINRVHAGRAVQVPAQKNFAFRTSQNLVPGIAQHRLHTRAIGNPPV